MKARVLLAVLFTLSAAACTGDHSSATDPGTGTREEPAPLYLAAAGNGVAGQFIVVLQDDSDPAQLARAAGATPRHVYRNSVRGFSARLTAGQVEAVRRTEGVAYVEQDQVARATVTDSLPGSLWGLDRIDQRARPLSRTITYTHTGVGVNVYVFDTGIQLDHPEFAGPAGSRAVFAYDAFGTGGADCNGHGTHVAGTIGGAQVGLAYNATLHAVRVLGCDGNGLNSDIIAAIEWVRVNKVRPAVANLSLGSGYSKTLNQAIDRLFSAGILPVVAAGNEAKYACDVSPASAVRALAVAAMDSLDQRSTFSNWGRCVSLYAPGSAIFSSWLGGGYAIESGTSMAAPHVSGVVAMYLQKYPTHTPAQVQALLLRNASSSRVLFNDSGTVMYGTPNLLLFTGGL